MARVDGTVYVPAASADGSVPADGDPIAFQAEEELFA